MLFEVHFWIPDNDCNTGLKSGQKIKENTLLKIIKSQVCDVMIVNSDTKRPICWIDSIGRRFRQR